MPTVVSNLMSGLLLLQAVSGWCYERAHTATTDTLHQVHCCGHDGCDSPAKPLEEPCETGEKCHGICVFTASSGPQVDIRQFSLADFVWTVERAIDLKLADRTFEGSPGNLPYLEPPLRLHLLHQIILV